MDKPFQAIPDTVVLPTFHPIPGIGLLPVNAFVIKAKEPILVDTRLGEDRGVLATSKIGTHWDPRDQGVGIAKVSFLSARL